MEWLRHRQKIIDLVQEGEALKALGDFAEEQVLALIDDQFEELSQALREALSSDTVFATAVNAADLVALLAIHDDTDEALSALSQILDQAGIDTARFDGVLRLAKESLSHVPDDYRKLLRHVDAFSEQLPGENPGLVSLNLNRTLTSDTPLAQGMAMELGGAGVATLELEANHLVADDERLLRIGVEGTLDATLSASAPLGAATVGGAAEAEGKIRADYLFEMSRERSLFALEAASAIPQLANPLSLDALFSTITSGDLDSMRLQFHGRTSFATKVGLAKRLDVAKLATVGGGVTIDADVWTGGHYTLDISAFEDGIRVDVSTSRAQGHSRGLKVGVTLNASQMAERVKAELAAPLAVLKHDIDEIEQFLQPGTALKQRIRAELDTQLDGDEPATLIASLALGFSDVGQTKTALATLVSGYLDSQTSAWQDDLTAAVSMGIQWITSRYPGLQHADVVPKLEAALQDAIKEGAANLQSRVTEISQNSERLDRLLDALASVGINVSSTLDKADAALLGVKKGLDNYRKLVSDLLTKAEEVATADLQFQLSHRVAVSSGATVDATATITRVNNNTRVAYAALVGGQIEKILPLADTSVAGFALTLGRWQQFAEHQKTDGISVVILDFELKDTTVFSSNARVQVESDGSISVLAEADWVKRRSFLKESREFHFSGVYRLSTARLTRSYRGAIDITYEDKRARRRDIQAFYERLIAAKLIAPRTTENALALLDEAFSKSGGTDVAMEVSAALELSAGELERLIGVSGARLSKRLCAEHTLRALRASGGMSEQSFALGFDGLRRTPLFDPNDTPAELLLSLTPARERKAKQNFSHHRSRDTLDAVKAWIRAKEKSIGLYNMLRSMAEVYEAEPLRQNMRMDRLETWYREKLEPIHRGLRSWVSFDTILVDPVKPQISDETLALLIILSELSDPDRAGTFPLQGYLRLQGEGGKIAV